MSIGDGRLDAAFRASCSAPVLWVPVRRGDRILVDGGLVDPVPAGVVREMGADLCIAVNAVPPLQKGVTNALTRLWRRVNALNPLLPGRQPIPAQYDGHLHEHHPDLRA